MHFCPAIPPRSAPVTLTSILSHRGRGGLIARVAGLCKGLLEGEGRVRVMTQISRARELRKQSTDAERLLWSRLRDRRLMGLKFKRQCPFGRYIVDFVCKGRNLIIEIDGGHHQEQQAFDLSRTAWLNSRGYTVIRYWNSELLADIDSVLESIRMKLEARRSPSPQPSPSRERVTCQSPEEIARRSPYGS